MALTDREKIIKGLECCMSETQCYKCPYLGECDDKGYYYSKAIEDAVALLKDDETQLQYRDDVIGCEEDEVKRLREILKEQEPAEPQRRYVRCDSKYRDLYICNICGYMDLHYKQQYCGGCGRKVSWNE